MVSPIDIQKALKGMDYPATKEQILEHAKGGEKDVLDDLRMQSRALDRSLYELGPLVRLVEGLLTAKIDATTFPADFDIFSPRRRTWPWPNTCRGSSIPADIRKAGQ